MTLTWCHTLVYWGIFKRLTLRNGLVHSWRLGSTGDKIWQLVVPASLRDDLLKELHDQPTAGHLGEKRTTLRVSARFFWPYYRRDVCKWCRTCLLCQARKPPQPRPRAAMHQYRVGAPMERVAMDILGPLPESHLGNKYILIVGDYFTR